jgi:hypothetical protein
MVPKFRHRRKRIKVCARNDAEISHPYSNAREAAVHKSVYVIEEPEKIRFRPATPLSEDRALVWKLSVGVQQSNNAFRGIFAVGIHHDHGIPSGLRLKIGESDRDGPLMSKISSELDDVDRLHRRQRSLKLLCWNWLNRPVVHKEDLNCTASV